MRVRSGQIDMCNGPILSNILKFSWPIIVTAFLQKLYHAADVIVVGRYAGQLALAGVGATASVADIALNVFLGLSIGVGVVAGNALGANDDDKVRKVVHTSMLLAILCGVFITIFNIWFADPILKATSVPKEVFAYSKTYMQINSLGYVPSMVYNFGAGILRAKGDSQRPMYIVFIAGVLNVLLNLLFVITFGMGTAGVALATVISQTFSAAVVIYIMMHESDNTRLHLTELKIHRQSLPDIIKIGVPTGIQNSVFGFANIIIQSGINSFGSAAIAGSAASASICGFYLVVLNSFSTSVSAFISQNMGARNYSRISKITGCCFLCSGVIWILEASLTVFGCDFLLGLYIPDDPEALVWGRIRFLITGCTYGLCGFMNIAAGSLRAMGYSMRAMFISLGCIFGIRLGWIFIVFENFRSFEILILSLPISWLGTFAVAFVNYLVVKRKIMKENIINNTL